MDLCAGGQEAATVAGWLGCSEAEALQLASSAIACVGYLAAVDLSSHLQ